MTDILTVGLYKVCLVCEDEEYYKAKESHDSPQKIASLVQAHLRGRDREEFVVVCLDTAHAPVKIVSLSVGDTSSTAVNMSLLARTVLLSGVSSFAVAHCHPSGRLSTSASDIAITKKIKDMSKILDLSFVDHIIVPVFGDGYHSIREESPSLF